MRILGVAEHWPKLNQPSWTTFRLPRRDKDWQVDEEVQVVFRPRSKQREFLGIAKIISKEYRFVYKIDDDEAVADGFQNWGEMWEWLYRAHKNLEPTSIINKLTLEWVSRLGP